jgi:hypothetical protein
MFGEPSRDYLRVVSLLKAGNSIDSISLALLFRVAAEGYDLDELNAAFAN